MYEKMYYELFNAMTDALHALQEQNFGLAGEIMRQAQQKAEEIFLNGNE